MGVPRARTTSVLVAPAVPAVVMVVLAVVPAVVLVVAVAVAPPTNAAPLPTAPLPTAPLPAAPGGAPTSTAASRWAPPPPSDGAGSRNTPHAPAPFAAAAAPVGPAAPAAPAAATGSAVAAALAAPSAARATPVAPGTPTTPAVPGTTAPNAPGRPPPDGVNVAGSAYTWPLRPPPAVITPFGAPEDPFGPGHRGVDLAGHEGEAIAAAAPGKVTFAGKVAGRGVVSIVHADGWVNALQIECLSGTVAADVTGRSPRCTVRDRKIVAKARSHKS